MDSPSKFYMYPRFLQLMINAQITDLSSYNTKYTSIALTQKVFANIRRVGKGFSGVDTPLFDGMLVPQQVHDNVADAAENEDAANDISAKPTPPLPTPATTLPPQQELIPLPSQEVRKEEKVESFRIQEIEEVTTAATLITAATTITAALVPKASASRRRRGVIIQDPEEAATASEIMQSEVKSKDKGKGFLGEDP
nr:hypothetical protein [Tanacetum cinerariifolium]